MGPQEIYKKISHSSMCHYLWIRFPKNDENRWEEKSVVNHFNICTFIYTSTYTLQNGEKTGIIQSIWAKPRAKRTLQIAVIIFIKSEQVRKKNSSFHFSCLTSYHGKYLITKLSVHIYLSYYIQAIRLIKLLS